MSSFSVPLSKLTLSPRNVRQSNDDDTTSTSDLEPTLLEHGQLQALIVHPMPRDRFGVTAGGRRLLAYQRLAARGAIAPDHPVEVTLRDENDATLTEISLIENIGRVALSPVEEYRAFQRLADDGSDIAAIARRFATTELHVRQRMRLGQLHPDILAALSAGRIGLDAAKAYAATIDQDLQRRVFGQGAVHAYEIRAAMKRDAASAGVDRMVQLVGMEAYTAAGGGADEDLFTPGEFRVLDIDLLRSLYEAKLAAEKARLALPASATLQFGWDGVGLAISPAPDVSEAEDEALEQRRVIDTRCDEISEQLDAIAEWDQDGPTDKLVAIPGQSQDEVARLQAEMRRLEAESEALLSEERAPEVDGPVIAVAAVRNGALQVVGYHRPLGWRPDHGRSAFDAPPALAHRQPEQAAKEDHGLSKDGLDVMRSHRRQLIAAALLEESTGQKLAGRLVAFVLARGMLGRTGTHGEGEQAEALGVYSLARHEYDPPFAREDLIDQPGAKVQRQALERLRAEPWMIEPDVGEAFRRFAHAGEADQRRALACVASAMLNRSLNLPGTSNPIHDAIGELLNIDVREQWTPDARFFARLPKGRRLEALREVDAGAAKRLGNLGNGELTDAAAAIMSGSREAAERYGLDELARRRAMAWTPEYLRFTVDADADDRDRIPGSVDELEAAE